MEQPQGFVDIVLPDGRVTPIKIETYTLIGAERLAKNITQNIGRPIPRMDRRLGFGAIKGEPLAIVAAGPTLNDTIESLRGFKNILVCGSAHDHLIRLGVVPTFAMVCDGGVDDKGNLSLRQKDTTYLIASQCDPSLFDHLQDCHVEMWHYRGQAAADVEAERELLFGEQSVGWGSTVGILSLSIALLLGYQDVHFFGFDSSYGDYGLKHHCCDIAGSMEYEKKPVTIGDKTFITDLGLIEQASQFFRFIEANHEFIHCTLYGDGMIAEMVRQGDPGLLNFINLA